jgi:hypothetical protein
MDKLSMSDTSDFLRNNKKFPIFDKNKKCGYTYKEIYGIIKEGDTTKMCTDVSSSVEDTAVFLIDTTKLKHINDI